MRVSKIFEYVTFAIPALVALAALASVLLQKRQNIMVTLEAGAANLKKRSWLVVLATLIYIVIFFLFIMVTKMTEATIRIGFNYPSASSGMNPNNTKFSVSQIIDDKVLEAAIIKGGFSDVTVDDLKACLKVTPVDAGETISAEQSYISAEYNLRYTASLKTIGLNPEAVVQQIANCFYEQFIDAYSRKATILENILGNTQSIDYLDLVDIIDAKADNIQAYAVMMQAESRSFQSTQTGETFISMEKKVQSFRDVQLERFRAFILENGLVKDRQQYISKLNYLNRVNNIDYQKRLEEHRIRLETINKYERDMASVVLIPSEDQNREFYMSRTQIGVDYFAREAEERLYQAISIQREISDNNYIITQIVNSAARDAFYQEAELMLENLKKELNYFADLMKITLEEYELATTRDYLSIVSMNGKNSRFMDRFQVKKGAVLTAAFLVSYTFWMLVQTDKKPKTIRPKKIREYKHGNN